MKFKYTGASNMFCLELVAYKIMGKDEYLKNGMVIEVPDDNTVVINALNAMGTFHPIADKKGKKRKKY